MRGPDRAGRAGRAGWAGKDFPCPAHQPYLPYLPYLPYPPYPPYLPLTKPIIAIDGPSGAGKGTVAREVAIALGYRHVDSGAMYRAVGWKALQEHVALDSEGERLRLALEAHPSVVKVNASEAGELLGVPTTRRDEAIAAAQKLRELAGGKGHAGLVTRGAAGVVLAAPDNVVYEAVLYVRGRFPVGSGDAFLAAFAARSLPT